MAEKHAFVYTLEMCKEDHHRIWDWLRKHPEMTKEDFLLSLKTKEEIDHFDNIVDVCALCEYTDFHSRSCDDCAMYEGDGGTCERRGSLYRAWDHEDDPEKRALLATEILKLGHIQKRLEDI